MGRNALVKAPPAHDPGEAADEVSDVVSLVDDAPRSGSEDRRVADDAGRPKLKGTTTPCARRGPSKSFRARFGAHVAALLAGHSGNGSTEPKLCFWDCPIGRLLIMWCGQLPDQAVRSNSTLVFLVRGRRES